MNPQAIDPFNLACKLAKSLPSLPVASRLELYALFKQGTLGQCKLEAPSMIDVEARAKWDAWSALGQLSSCEAKSRYVAAVSRILEGSGPRSMPQGIIPVSEVVNNQFYADSSDFDGIEDDILEENVSAESVPRSGGGGLGNRTTSRPVEEEASSLAADDPWQCAREGSVAELVSLLDRLGLPPTSTNEAGESLLHAAADGGNCDAITLLVSRGAGVNVVEPEGGCTPLHYAALGDHSDAISALLTARADVHAMDSDGRIPAELAGSLAARSLLSVVMP